MTAQQKTVLAGFYQVFATILALFGSLVTLTFRHFFIFWAIFIFVLVLQYLAYLSLNKIAQENVIILPQSKKPYRSYIILAFILSTFLPIFTSGILQIVFSWINIITFVVLFYFEFTVTKKEQEEILALNPTKSIQTIVTYKNIRANFRGLLLFTLVIYFIIFLVYVVF